MTIAVFTGTEAEFPWPRPELRLLEPVEDEFEIDPPALVALRRRPASTAVRRRRLAVLAVAALLAVLALPLRSLAAGSDGAANPSASGSLPLTSSAGQGSYYVVRPGDTLASIAARVDPSHPHAVLAGLTAEVGSSVIVPGEHLRVP